jgi:hypothetical protein
VIDPDPAAGLSTVYGRGLCDRVISLCCCLIWLLSWWNGLNAGLLACGSGVRGTMKNLIFAVVGPKPEIVFDDAVNNDLRIVSNESGLRPAAGRAQPHLGRADRVVGRPGRHERVAGTRGSLSLYRRLDRSLGENDAERRILSAYARRYVRLGPDIPALIPQVYLHYDPYTRTRYLPSASPLPFQRMDFLLLLLHRVRVVIECDGKQHYADDDGRAGIPFDEVASWIGAGLSSEEAAA